ncbi:hypothetical protein AWB68_06592 [Caballeronia choica]|jgi:hypothetical protein|uniref:Lipoprotein n=1 Tax=Caballeronia choica TaxID=326476 RepID=A0A158KPG8_9BURK|nr:hypothetical protein [Caballeronia choica]SAL82623.1 hypothetical protein AWB68_06592 [Caballeronia choica]
MKSRLMLMLLSVMAAGGANAQAVPAGSVMWAANPVGQQPMPNAPPLALLSYSGTIFLRTADGGECVLVARRGTQIVAVELSPVVDGPKLVGWSPKQIDMDTLTSKWGYKLPQTNGPTSAFENPVTKSIASTSKVGAYSSASASAWSNTSVDVHRKDVTEQESSETVTVNGKTYQKFSHFKETSGTTPVSASDEYICE